MIYAEALYCGLNALNSDGSIMALNPVNRATISSLVSKNVKFPLILRLVASVTSSTDNAYFYIIHIYNLVNIICPLFVVSCPWQKEKHPIKLR